MSGFGTIAWEIRRVGDPNEAPGLRHVIATDSNETRTLGSWPFSEFVLSASQVAAMVMISKSARHLIDRVNRTVDPEKWSELHQPADETTAPTTTASTAPAHIPSSVPMAQPGARPAEDFYD